MHQIFHMSWGMLSSTSDYTVSMWDICKCNNATVITSKYNDFATAVQEAHVQNDQDLGVELVEPCLSMAQAWIGFTLYTLELEIQISDLISRHQCQGTGIIERGD